MKETKKEYFERTQMIERECIQRLYQLYFKQRDCTNYYEYPISGHSSVDFEFVSGASRTKVVCEFKRRNISTMKYNDTFIERIKFKELYKYVIVGNYPLFIIEYDDYYFFFDLEYQFFLFRPYVNHDHIFFSEFEAAANGYDYDEKVDKMVRWLHYYDATLILDKRFEEVSYSDYLQYRLCNTK